jgi:uncharacterized protein (TIGR03790 family)
MCAEPLEPNQSSLGTTDPDAAAWRPRRLRRAFAVLVAAWSIGCGGGGGETPAASTALDDSVELDEDGVVRIDVLENDSGVGLSVISVTGSDHGTSRLITDGIVEYTPDADYAGSDTVGYTTQDAHGQLATALITFIVRPQPDAPSAADDEATTAEDQPVVIAVLDNDVDVDGDPLSLSITSQPGFGEAEVVGDTILYTPALGFDGEDRFDYKASDSGGSSAEASVHISVEAIDDDPPVTTDDRFVVVEGTETILDVLINDHDPEGRPLDLEVLVPPSRGSTLARDDGSIAYTAPGHYNGPVAFAYRVSDPSGGTAEAVVELTVYASLEDPSAPQIRLPPTGLRPEQLGVVVNDADPLSVAVAEYYLARRPIPAENVVHLWFETDGPIMDVATFEPLAAQLAAELDPSVQALALTWTEPYRVDCMSVTSAFALGFDLAYCKPSGQSCGSTAAVTSFASDSLTPFDDHGVRPTMALAGETLEDVQALIDRGIAADGLFPTSGTGMLVRTSDVARSVRWQSFVSTLLDWDTASTLALEYIDNADGGAPEGNAVSDRDDLFAYFTGLDNVPDIDTNTYLPGAVADHVTSFGGKLTDSGSQMSILRWLEAGATASYGTVVEPCNFTAKFPDPRFVLRAYYRGRSVLEAYWTSVSWPGEGIFVGEPLARPWGRVFLEHTDGTLTIRTTQFTPGRTWSIEAADAAEGPWETVLTGITVDHHHLATVRIEDADRAYYALVED